ncbi:DUF4142 domain-containing protein [Streptomyces alkaliphilus]|uniref:DUF4142 domain-containing protein n=1 Tax=Streptomyces alkaliphilus TaxID=1472722 RepID=A0A7W3THU9_9ACTN|nr:DUF4142 domain-containing protein [Streptomyces alkaliphilus]MBB0247111.1 DUF4142 domain-containing protein [Streptomyces alkaliphilus]
MKRTRLVAAAVTALAMAGTSTGTALADDTATDAGYLQQSRQGNLTEILAGEDALENARSECVRHVGEVLIRDHTLLDADVTTLADARGVELPDAPSPEQQRVLDEVSALAGTEEYETAWLLAQEEAHLETLDLIDTQVEYGTDEEITAAALSARPIVAMHLEMVRGGVCRAGVDPAYVPAGFGPR